MPKGTFATYINLSCCYGGMWEGCLQCWKCILLLSLPSASTPWQSRTGQSGTLTIMSWKFLISSSLCLCLSLQSQLLVSLFSKDTELRLVTSSCLRVLAYFSPFLTLSYFQEFIWVKQSLKMLVPDSSSSWKHKGEKSSWHSENA